MNAFLKKLPSTNYRIFWGVVMAGVVILYTLTAGVAEGLLEKDVLIDRDYLELLRNFILLVLALDVAQFTAKRATHKPGVGEPEPEDNP